MVWIVSITFVWLLVFTYIVVSDISHIARALRTIAVNESAIATQLEELNNRIEVLEEND